MRRAWLLVLFGVALLGGQDARGADPTGLWWAEGGAAQIEITRCGDALCGRIVWLRSPLDESGCPVRDAENPDAALRGRGLIGIDLLERLRPSSHDRREWAGGYVYDPTSGRSYSAVLRMDGPDRIQLRGYLGFELLGRTTTWFRVGGELQCREAA
jgi:uncharacterized protein (DUF2147 family)